MQDERPKGLLNGVGQAARVLLGLILLAMVLLNVVNAFSRYALSYVVIGIDELLVFAMIWMVMVGMLLVTADRSHIALEIVRKREGQRTFEVLPRRWVVERTFAWLSRNRRLAKAFEQTIASATAWLFIASIQLFTRRIARA